MIRDTGELSLKNNDAIDLAVKELSALLTGISSKHHGDFSELPSFFCKGKKT